MHKFPTILISDNFCQIHFSRQKTETRNVIVNWISSTKRNSKEAIQGLFTYQEVGDNNSTKQTREHHNQQAQPLPRQIMA